MPIVQAKKWQYGLCFLSVVAQNGGFGCIKTRLELVRPF